jgi:cell division septum initiation protein DivIVA
MDVLAILEQIEGLISNSARVPLTDKVIISENEVLRMIDELHAALPDELEQANWIVRERDKVLKEAQTEAERIREDTRSQVARMADDHEITRMANDQANEIINQAKRVAKEIRTGANEYADGLLLKSQEQMEAVTAAIRNARKEIEGNQ